MECTFLSQFSRSCHAAVARLRPFFYAVKRLAEIAFSHRVGHQCLKQSLSVPCVYIWFIAFEWHRIRTSPCFSARTAFEKMTDVDYQGETYYTIRNLSLYECQVSELQLSTFPMLFRCPKPSYIYSPK